MPHRSTRRWLAIAMFFIATLQLGCSTPTKIIATPVTVVRDVVDVPVTSIANLFEHWANQIKPGPPSVGIGVGLGGVSPTVGFNLGYYIFKPLSWIFGSVDYLVCRSFYPCWPTGISPWLGADDTIGSLYFPNTRYLWRDEAPDVDNTDTDTDTADTDRVDTPHQ